MLSNLETRMHADFRVIRVIEKRLMASDCHLSLTIDISPDQKSAKDRIKAMRLWLERFVDGCVAISSGDGVDTTMLEQITNNVMICPDEPHDYLLLILIHSKLNAIGGGEVIVESTSMDSDTGEGFSNTFSGPADEWLPSIKEWIGPLTFHDVPWWRRADSSTMDMKPLDGDDVEKIPDLGSDLIAMVRAPLEEREEAPERMAEIIRPAFKPRLVKSDD